MIVYFVGIRAKEGFKGGQWDCFVDVYGSSFHIYGQRVGEHIMVLVGEFCKKAIKTGNSGRAEVGVDITRFMR